MALPLPLAAALAASGAMAVASIFLFYMAHFRNATIELRKARLFLRYARFEGILVAVVFMVVGTTLLLLGTLAVAPDVISDIPDVPMMLVVTIPVSMGHIYAYYVGRGKEPPLLKLLKAARGR